MLYESFEERNEFRGRYPQRVELAEFISVLIPSIQKVRLVSSGAEAVMSAVRLARGFTNRKMIE